MKLSWKIQPFITIFKQNKNAPKRRIDLFTKDLPLIRRVRIDFHVIYNK